MANEQKIHYNKDHELIGGVEEDNLFIGLAVLKEYIVGVWI